MNTHLWLAQKLAQKAQDTVAKGDKVIKETEVVLRDTELELREMKERRPKSVDLAGQEVSQVESH
jgi:hypothetical protein